MVTYKIVDDAESPSLFSHKYMTLQEKKKEKKPRVIVLAGPTAIGKTELSIELALLLGGEIISADSMQVYRGMDIGTAKATQKQRQRVPHHMIDVCDVKEECNVVHFFEQAQKACEDILRRSKVPIIVGGSGFYIRVLLYGPPQGPPASCAIRQKLQQQSEEMGIEVLYEQLQLMDPEYARSIGEKDKHKIIRALEIITLTKKPVSAFAPNLGMELRYDFRNWFLYMSRQALFERIDKRCEEMIENGFIEEVIRLQKEGLLENYSASQAIGYRQCLSFLETDQSQKEYQKFLESFKRASRRYVKKQYTWFRKEPFFRWLDCDALDRERIKELILQDYEQGT